MSLEGETLQKDFNLIPPDSVLVPPHEGSLVDSVELEIGPLQQGLTVEEACPHVVVGGEHLPPPRRVDHPPTKASLLLGLGDLVTEVKTDGLHQAALRWGGGWRTSR